MEGDTFRDFVTRWLGDSRISAADLSSRAGIDQSGMSKYLHTDPRRRVRPSPRSLEKLAPVLGVAYEDLLRMCGYLPGEPRAQVDARRQAVRDQLDQWLSAVGPENEEYFWHYLKAQGDSTVDLIRQVGTAVNEPGDAAVNAAVSARKRRGRKPRGDSGSPLTQRQHPAASHFTDRTATSTHRRAA
jgi:transcriptional regulator with XRE-family HTH domain